jgi:hypothetical protein
MKTCMYCSRQATIFLEQMSGNIPMCEYHFRENVRMCEEDEGIN